MRRLIGTVVLGATVLGMVSACGGGGSAAPAAPYTAFAAPVRVTIAGYSGDAMEPFLSKDGRFLFFNSRNDPAVDTDLYVATRVDDSNFAFAGKVTGANSGSLDGVASLDALGNFYFVSTRSYVATLSTLYAGRWNPGGGVSGVDLVAGVSLQQPGAVNFDAEISADGQTLWFDDGRYSTGGALQAASLAVATRQGGGGFLRDPGGAAVLAAVNAQGLNYAPCISVDGRELFFTRLDSITASPALYRATRPDTRSAFAAPARVAAAEGFVEAPTLSADGRLLYFHQLVDGVFVIQLLRR